ncbi:methyltransferase [Spirosoma montaniterrae]|uniref:tRNA1(Val) (adenine(37)-N6)-methyltransferase n=2 Tax=Spirosoma montaniterrae TaxID=1178516 RepID=A0A1P9WUS2_9BACT|nr:methyltransferase [Spirosoma montaniterrae]AQG79127.1 methyltransferase [Spirosoma montaniterrae]
MKVCTDACVLGAYADVGSGAESRAERVLDIGTGTGLLALMAAQRKPTTQVDAVEIDDEAFRQAVDNVAHSPFAGRVRVWHGPIQSFDGEPYDRILTNPPFYTNHLRSPDAAVNRALHTGELPFTDLLTAVSRLLRRDGQWWVLLPPYEAGLLSKMAQTYGLRPFRRLYLRHNTHKPPFRVITGFGYGPETATDETLFIYEIDNRTYTPAFRALLQDFYLIF